MNNEQFFQDKVIIITGASSGIGRAAAIILARLKAKVVLASRNKEKLELLKEEIQSKNGKAIVVQTDITSFEETQRMVKETLSKWGKIELCVANAGEYVQDVTHEIDLKAFEHSMAVNFFGTLHVIKSVLPEMRCAGKGHIIIVNSLDAKKGIIDDGPYAAAKCALDGFGDVLRQKLKKEGIKITSIYPGRVDTPMIENIKVPWISPKISPEKVVKAMIKGIRRNKATVIVPSGYFLLGPLNQIFPRFVDWSYRLFKIEGEKFEE